MADILYGIKRVVLTELDPATQQAKVSGIKCFVDTADSCELEPVISEGEEEVARTDERILAVVRTEDLLYGYDVTLKDNCFEPTVAGLLGNEKITRASGSGDTPGEVTSVESHMISDGAKVKPFKAEIYIANYEGDSIKNYVCLTLNNCTGKMPKFSVGKEFYAPEFEIKAREASKAKLPIKKITYVEALPTPPKGATVVGVVTRPNMED